MTETPADDQPGFLAEEPEHCHECYRLILAGETYYETDEDTWLCEQCAGNQVLDTIQVTDDLVVELVPGQLRLRRGDKAMVVRLNEVRHLVDVLVNGTANRAGALVDGTEMLAKALASKWVLGRISPNWMPLSSAS